MGELSENVRDRLMEAGQLRAERAGGDAAPYVNLYYQKFPGRFDLSLKLDEAHALAMLLRTKGPGEAGPLSVGTVRFIEPDRQVIMPDSRFTDPDRQVINLTYRMGVNGQFYTYLSDDDARRLADELDAAVQRATHRAVDLQQDDKPPWS